MSPHCHRRRVFLESALFDQVLACAEGFRSRASDDQDAERWLSIVPGKEGVGFPVREGGQGVHLGNAVDG